jgi:hypothetical protein
MNDTENRTPAEYDLTQSQAQFNSLRQLVNTVLILLVIVSGTLTMFLLNQYKFVRTEVLAVRPQWADAHARYVQIQPKMDDFVRRMSDFARTHPDFASVLSKYMPKQPPTGASAAPGKK